MPRSVVSKSDKFTPNLWKEAYSALNEDDKGKERLHKLNVILKDQIGKPRLRVRSDDGYKQLQVLIREKSQSLAAGKSSEKFGKVGNNMLAIQELVSAGVNVGGPYVAIPAAALFLAFSVHQIYRSEKELMFELGEKVAHYTVLHATSVERIKKMAGDDHHMRDLKRNLHVLYVGLYKSLLRASAQLTISLYGDWQFVKNLTKHYDWEGQIKELDGYHKLCNDYRDEMIARQKDMSLAEAGQQKATGLAQVSLKPKKGTDFVSPPHDKEKAVGPGPMNPLHWAVALGVSEQVTYFVQKEEYAINAFTPKRWTVAHLAAEQGSTKIMKTLSTVPGLDLRIENNDGRTALHIAALHNKVGVLKLLLQRDKQLLGRRDGRGRTAFLLAAQKGHIKILTALKEQGQDFNDATATNGWTALHFAAEGGHADTVKYLLANGSNKATKVKAGNSKGLTARQVAEQKKKLKIVAIL